MTAKLILRYGHPYPMNQMQLIDKSLNILASTYV